METQAAQQQTLGFHMSGRNCQPSGSMLDCQLRSHVFDPSDWDTLGLTLDYCPSYAISACHLIALFYPCQLGAYLCKSDLTLCHLPIRPQEVPVHILQQSQECTKLIYHIAVNLLSRC